MINVTICFNLGKTKIHRKSQSQSHIADKNRNRNGKVKIAIANLTIAEKNHKSQSRNSAIAMPLEALTPRHHFKTITHSEHIL